MHWFCFRFFLLKEGEWNDVSIWKCTDLLHVVAIKMTGKI